MMLALAPVAGTLEGANAGKKRKFCNDIANALGV